MQVTMVIKAHRSFEKNETNLGRNGFPSQPIWKRWFIQEKKKGSQGKKTDKAVIHRKKYQPFSHESSNRCSASKSLTLVGTRSWAKSQEDYSRLKLSVFPDLLSRSSWWEHIKLLLEQSKEIFPIRSLVQIPLVCQLWHHKQRQKSVILLVCLNLHLFYMFPVFFTSN